LVSVFLSPTLFLKEPLKAGPVPAFFSFPPQHKKAVIAKGDNGSGKILLCRFKNNPFITILISKSNGCKNQRLD
ncbi:hypothetical protein, partial [Hominenteromicrobium sp.]